MTEMINHGGYQSAALQSPRIRDILILHSEKKLQELIQEPAMGQVWYFNGNSTPIEW